jgi:hypothetical protein
MVIRKGLMIKKLLHGLGKPACRHDFIEDKVFKPIMSPF